MTNQPNVNPFDISDEEMRFGSDSDVFKRENFAKQLLKIIQDMPGERVILLDAPWGEGKTVFAKMFENHLEEQKYKAIYYDTFAHDYYEQPLLPFMEEIYQLIDEGKKENKIKAKKALCAVAKDILNTTTAGAAQNTIEQLFKAISQSKNNLNELKEYLTALPDNMKDEYKGKPIIFIIDELDRCKPTYAIKILEIIKHLFSVPNIVFVLVANSEQLCQSIKHEYGNDIDSYNYLHKFIHLRMTLPKKNNGIDNSIYTNHCIDRLKFTSEYIDDIKYISDQFSIPIQLSFREIERYQLTLKIMLTLLNDDSKNHPLKQTNVIAIIYIVIIKKKFPNIYIKLSNKNITYEECIDLTSIKSAIENEQHNIFIILGDLLKLHLNEDLKTNPLKRLNQNVQYTNIHNQVRDVSECIGNVINTLDHLHLC